MASSSSFKRTKTTAGRYSQSRLFWPGLTEEERVDSIARYNLLLGATIAPGRRVNFKSFGYQGFAELCNSLIWTDFLSLELPTYPKLLAVFYTNLKSAGPSSLRTFIQGQEISFSKLTLNKHLRIPMTGKILYEKSFEDAYPFANFASLFLPSAQSCFNTNELLPLPRMFHHVLCSNINPKLGNKNRVNLKNYAILYAFCTGDEIDLADFIIKRMQRPFDKKSFNLPFGMIVTKLLMLNGIDFSDEESIDPLTEFNKKSLSMMHVLAFLVNRTIHPFGTYQDPASSVPPSHSQTSTSRDAPRFSSSDIEDLHRENREIQEELVAIRTDQARLEAKTDESNSMLKKLMDFIMCKNNRVDD